MNRPAGALTLIFTAALALAVAPPARAVPVAPIPRTVQQPDGTTLQIIPTGDEYNVFWELPSGYTVVRDAQGWWRVAGLDSRGRLEPRSESGAGTVSAQSLAALPRHLRPTLMGTEPGELHPVPAGAREATVRALSAQGTVQRVLVILVEFNDQAPVGATTADFANAFFGTGKSVAGYYHQATFGRLEMAPANDSDGTPNDGVVGWLKLDMDHPRYALSSYDQATDDQKKAAEHNSREAIKAAIEAADPYVDFAAYDTNGDGVITRDELAVVVITAGYEASFGGYSTDYPRANWGHRWSFGGRDDYNDVVTAPVVDGVTVGDGRYGGGYSTFGEWMQSSAYNGHRSTIGVMVHELGHDSLGLPDLYDTDDSSYGIGAWGLMGAGSWGEDTTTDHWQGETPVLFCGWSRVATGISRPHDLTGNGTVDVVPSYADGTVYRIGSGTDNEYFLAEYRVPLGFDGGLRVYDTTGFASGGGLAVWHVDESESDNTDDSHRKVDLEEADGLNRLDSKTKRAARSMLYFNQGGQPTTFDDSTTPDAHRYDGSPSGVALAVGVAGDTIPMTYAAPNPVGFPGDDCSTAINVELSPSRPYPLTGLSLAQATGGDTPALCAPITATGWFKVTPERTGTLSLSTDGSDFDTVAAVLGGSCGNLQVLACNDDIGGVPHNTGSVITGVPVEKGVPVYVVIGMYDAGAGGGGTLAGSISLSPATALTVTTTQLSGCPRTEWQVTVTDASGPLTDLNAGSFTMTADGRSVSIASVENLGGGAYRIVSYGVIGGTSASHSLALQVDTVTESGEVDGSVAEAGTQCTGVTQATQTLVVPGAAHLVGNAGTNWRTDVFGSVIGTGGYALVDATYLPETGSSSMAPVHRVTAIPEGGASFDDAAALLFGIDAGKGSVLVRWEGMNGGRLALTSRTYNLLLAGNPMGLDAGSTFGQEMPAVPLEHAISPGGHAWITGLVQEEGVARTNLGLVAAGPSGAAVTLDFTGADGTAILSRQVELAGYEYTQLNQVLLDVAGGVAAASVKISVASGGDPVVAYASVVDGTTGDPVTLLPTATPASMWYVPAAAHVSGKADTNWRTDLALFNPGSVAVDVTVAFLQEKQDNSSPQESAPVHLAAGASQRIENVLPTLFGRTGVKGALRVSATGEIVVASRTYNELLAGNAWGLAEGATFGQNVSPLTPDEALAAGQTGVVPGLVRDASFRSNLVMLNTAAGQTQMVISAVAADGASLGTPVTVTLLPYEYRQINDVLSDLGVSGDVTDATLKVEVTAGSAAAFLSVVDERTGDPVSRTTQE